jgi:hypothetical protein
MSEAELRRKDELKKIKALTSKATVSTSLKEKNDLLMEIMQFWTPQIDLLEKSQTLLNLRHSELNVLRKQLSAAQRERESLRQNTAFYQSGGLGRRKQASDLINLIAQTEQEIMGHHPLPYPTRLSDAKLLPEGNSHLFNLVDLYLHRLEELSYAYKKRLFVVEASQDSEKEVMQKHGSIQELVRKVEEFEKENNVLKQAEKTFIGNPVTKRRKFAEMTPFCARHFANIFRIMLQAERVDISAFRRREFTDGYRESDLNPIDTVLNDPGFCGRPDAFDAGEFGNTTEPEGIAPLIESEDLKTKLDAYGVLVKKSEAVLKKLKTEIATLKAKGFIVPDGATGRADKLTEANERLLHRISRVNTSIDASNTSVRSLISSLVQVARERSAQIVTFVDMLGDMKALVNSHIALLKKATQNRQTVLLLLHIALAFGRDLLASSSPDSPLAALLQGQFGAIISQLQEEDAAAAAEAAALAQETARADDNEKEEQSVTATEILERLTMYRRRRKTPAHARGSPARAFSRAASTHHMVTHEPEIKRGTDDPRFFVARHRIELLHGVAIGAELAGFIIGVDKPFRKTIADFLRPFLATALEQTSASVEGFGGRFVAQLADLNIMANRLLVKSKEAIAIQTDVAARTDEEIQTGDAPGTKPKQQVKGKK